MAERIDLTVAWFVAAVLRRPRLAILTPLCIAIAAAASSFLIRPQYESSAAFVPETRSMPALNPALTGLASQLGVNLGGQAAQSPQFYADVLRSREVLEAALLTRFATPAHPGDSLSLLDLLEINDRRQLRRLEMGAKALNDRLAIDVDPRTSIVRIAVEAPGPQLAHDVAGRLLDLLNDFNLKRRQSQARERRRFTEQRLTAADSSLRAAEERLRSFYETNRLWQTSPALTFEEARLRRDLTLRQELQLMLSRDLETARLEEVNDTPVLTIIDRPDVPQRKSRPQRLLITLSAAIVAGVLCSALAFVLQRLEDLRSEGHPDLDLVKSSLRGLRALRWRPHGARTA